MKRFGLLALFSLALPAVSAACTLNGQEVACSSFFATMGAFLFIGGLLVLLTTIFWIWILVDCIKREFSDKVLWILLIVLTGFLGAIIYYFVVKRAK